MIITIWGDYRKSKTDMCRNPVVPMNNDVMLPLYVVCWFRMEDWVYFDLYVCCMGNAHVVVWEVENTIQLVNVSKTYPTPPSDDIWIGAPVISM